MMLYKETIESFEQDFGAISADIIVSVGASIGVCCCEVGEDINTEAQSLDLGFAIEKKEDSYFLNISKILKKQLLNPGSISL